VVIEDARKRISHFSGRKNFHVMGANLLVIQRDNSRVCPCKQSVHAGMSFWISAKQFGRYFFGATKFRGEILAKVVLKASLEYGSTWRLRHTRVQPEPSHGLLSCWMASSGGILDLFFWDSGCPSFLLSL
jgi:hypothetical protein